MALPSKVDEIPFTGGLHENEDTWVQTQGFLRLENCYEDKDGALIKLPGYVAVPTTSRSGLVSALSFEGEGKYVKRGKLIGSLLRGTLWAKLDEWTPQGHVSPWVCEQTTVIETEGERRMDCCAAGAWSFTVFEVPAAVTGLMQLRIAVSHQGESGETVMLSAAISDGAFDCFYPRICQWGVEDGAALLTYVRNGFVRFRRIKIDSTGISVAAEGPDIQAVSSAATPLYDIHKDPGQSTFALCVCNGGANIAVATATFDPTALNGYTATVVTAAPGNVTAVAVWYSSSANQLVFAYAHHVAAAPFRHRVRGGVRQYSAIANVVVAESTIWQRTADSVVPPAQADSVRTLACIGVAATGWYFTFFDPNPPTPLYGGESAIGYVPTQRGVFLSSGGTVAGTADFCGWVRMVTKPFYYDGRVYLLAQLLITGLGVASATDEAVNRAYVLLGTRADLTGTKRLVPFGYLGHTQAPTGNYYVADDQPVLTRMSQPFQDDVGNWHMQAYEADAGTLRARIRDYALFADDRVGSFAELGGQTYVTGALLSAWDGLRCIEAGVLRSPTVAVSQVAGALAAGTRYYKLTFVRFSASGEMLRSMPSAARIATNTAIQDNRVQFTPLCITATSDSDTLPWFVEIWRTKAGETSPFYLVTRIALDPDLRDYTNYTDSVADATITGTTNGPTQLYTDGSGGQELGNDPPISPLHLCEWRNRLWLTDGDQIQYSKEGAPSRAAEFSANFVLPKAIEQRLTAVAPLGDVLAAFSEDQTAYVYGDGPAANGDGSSLTGPISVPVELGCTQPSGLVVVPHGVLVPTRRGIQMLDTKRSYSFVGEGIESTLALYPRIRDADYQLGDDLVWFVLNSTSGTNGSFALLNLRTGTWSRAFIAPLDTAVPVTVRHVGTDQFWGDVSGVCQERLAGSYLLNAAPYQQKVYLPWVKAAGMVGEMRFRRMWLLASRAPQTALDISVWYNYKSFGSSADSVVQLDNTELAGLEDADKAVLLRLAPERQRCVSFAIALVENIDSGLDNSGFRFVSLRVETAQRRPRGAVVKVGTAGLQ